VTVSCHPTAPPCDSPLRAIAFGHAVSLTVKLADPLDSDAGRIATNNKPATRAGLLFEWLGD